MSEASDYQEFVDWYWKRSLEWLGCTTDADFYNGSCAWRARKPKPQASAATDFKTKAGKVYLPAYYAP